MRTDRILTFLRNIRANNNRPYFYEHKKDYETAKEDWIEIVAYLIEELRSMDSSIEPLEPKDCMYRFNRDTRFSPDKSPYKRHFGAFIAPRGGRKSLLSGYYIHIEPDNNSLAVTGVYCLEKPQLNRVRDVIVNFPEEWRNVFEAPEIKNDFRIISTQKLKRLPMGFTGEYECEEYLKMKDFMAEHQFTDEDVQKEDFPQKVVELFRKTIRMSTYLNDIILGE
ncbi:MAG: DUF2461 domain-containing protein [Paludibacteraceae bacterium]|nr:DUF2461 domain-containing protein [Paludibacteraceae bacterium]